MILTGKLFKYEYAINDVVMSPVVVCADDMTEADRQLFRYAARQVQENPGSEGVHVRILAVTEIDPETL